MKESPTIKILTYAYITLPVFLFYVCWSKPVFAAIIGVIIVGCTYSCIRNGPRCEFSVSIGKHALLWLMILCLGVLSGIGGYVFQNGDHVWRNALMNILTKYDWPVLYQSGDSYRGLIYYIGFWIPSACIGKVLGLSLGYLFMLLWAMLGIFLTWYHLCRYLKVFSLWVFVGFFMFSGLDFVGQMLRLNTNALNPLFHIEWWARIQFSSFTTQLFWVFNQAIPSWILFLVIMQETSNRNLLFLLSFGLIECTFPFVGMLPFVVYKALDNTLSLKKGTLSQKVQNLTVSLCTPENIIGGGVVGILSFLYLSGNDSGQHFDVGFPSFRYAIFICLEAGIYFVFVRKYHRGTLAWLTLVLLLLIPLISVGQGGDFCMRASIPALMILFLLVADCWRQAWIEQRKSYLTILGIVFAIGAITPAHEIARTIWVTGKWVVKEKRMYVNNAVPDEEILGKDIKLSNNFSGNTENNIFYRYIAK